MFIGNRRLKMMFLIVSWGWKRIKILLVVGGIY